MAEQESKTQIVQKQIPVEKLLMHFGKSQIQLLAVEEELNQARSIIQGLQNQVNQFRKELGTIPPDVLAKARELTGAATDGEAKPAGPELVPAAS